MHATREAATPLFAAHRRPHALQRLSRALATGPNREHFSFLAACRWHARMLRRPRPCPRGLPVLAARVGRVGVRLQRQQRAGPRAGRRGAVVWRARRPAAAVIGAAGWPRRVCGLRLVVGQLLRNKVE